MSKQSQEAFNKNKTATILKKLEENKSNFDEHITEKDLEFLYQFGSVEQLNRANEIIDLA